VGFRGGSREGFRGGSREGFRGESREGVRRGFREGLRKGVPRGPAQGGSEGAGAGGTERAGAPGARVDPRQGFWKGLRKVLKRGSQVMLKKVRAEACWEWAHGHPLYRSLTSTAGGQFQQTWAEELTSRGRLEAAPNGKVRLAGFGDSVATLTSDTFSGTGSTVGTVFGNRSISDGPDF
jgi:hypothetical protein